MSPAEINQDPVQGEFFSSESDLAERLVRESIQNSLDAKLKGETARVRFAFSRDRLALSANASRPYLNGFRRHLEAVTIDRNGTRPQQGQSVGEGEAVYEAFRQLDQPMTWLAVEDFGTRGLTGQIEGNRERESDNHFWGFFRSIGISPKGEDFGGSWGLGKWVFPDASMINAYIGITRRIGEVRDLLMGMAILKTHHIDQDKFPPYGQFASFSEDDDSTWLPMPADSSARDGDFIDRAIHDFALLRSKQPGLSVVVPWPKPELNGSSIARAVLTQYFLPILKGDLVVEIDDPDETHSTLDSATLESELSHVAQSERDDESPESMRGLIHLARWAIERQEDDFIRVPSPAGNTSAKRQFDEYNFDSLRERYNHSERLAIEINVSARRSDSTAAQSQSSVFRIYLERADDLLKGHDYFVRGHLRIPHMDHITSFHARALILVDGTSELGHLLRDSEGPAHTKWDPHAERLKEGWSGGYRRVQEVRRTVPLILRQLVDDRHERQLDALADLFPADLPALSRGKQQSQSRGGGVSTRPDVPVLTPSSALLNRISGGFRVAPVGERPPALGSRWSVRFAYDMPRGGKSRAFRAFASGVTAGSFDFDLERTLAVQANGVRCSTMSANELMFTVQSANFDLRVTGFDERDLLVELEEMSEHDVDMSEAAG